MRSRLLLFVGVVLLSTSIYAQQPAAPVPTQNQLPADVEATLSATAKRDVSARSGTPGDAGLARTGVEAILNASSTSSNVRARLGFEAAQRWFVDGVLTAPIDSDNDLTRTAGVGASAGSLADDAQFSIGFGRVDWSYRTDVDAAAKICADVAQKGLGPCNTVNPKLPEDLRQALRSTFSIGTAYTYGARLSVGRSTFRFREAPGDATRTERHYVPLAVTGGLGALLRSNWFIAVQGGAERVRNGHSPQTFCSPLDDTGGTLRCENVALGVPAQDTGLVLVVEARRLFARAAFAPRFEYRQTKDLRLFEVPVYFLSDPDVGGWTGGVILRVKNRDPSVAVFVGPLLPYFGLK